MRITATLAVLAFTALPTFADDVSDTIESALAAYQEGDLAYAQEELAFAIQLLKQMKAQSLEGFLPAPMEGWTREITDDASGMAVMGGSGASARYSNGTDTFSLSILADNPMVASMGAVIANPAMMAASGGKLIRVGRMKFMAQDEQLMGMVDNRILIQTEDGKVDDVVAHLKSMDFKALADFGN